MYWPSFSFEKVVGKSKQMCYHKKEVNIMEEERMESAPLEEAPYAPRPKWQVWLARLGLVVFVLFLIMYYIILFRGG